MTMRFKTGKQLWQEDDATVGIPDHETCDAAWLRITGAPFDRAQALVEVDNGDLTDFFCRVPGEKVYLLTSSYPGESAIFEVEEVEG